MGCVTFFQDLRDIRRLERQRLVQAERLAATGQTAASIAHAIKEYRRRAERVGCFVVNKGFEFVDNRDYLQQGWGHGPAQTLPRSPAWPWTCSLTPRSAKPEYRPGSGQSSGYRGGGALLKARAEEFNINLTLGNCKRGWKPVAMDCKRHSPVFNQTW